MPNPNLNPNPNPNPNRIISSHLYLILFSLLLLRSSALRSDPRSIFLLAGQSNMAGRGGVINNRRWDGVVPSESEPNPSILRLNAKLKWVEAKEPLHKDIDTNHTCGVGPGMAFANTVSSKEPGLGPIGLVPCAVGGTGISQWARGGVLYSRLVKRALASVKGGGSIQALIWYQGERDALFRGGAVEYQRRLEKFFSDVRADLQSPMLPIIQVVIASGEGPYIETVRQAQLGIDLLNVKNVDAMGLPLEPDHLHLTTPAQVALGERLASAFLQFLPTQTQVLPTRIQSNTAYTLLINFFPTYLTVLITFLLNAALLKER